MGKVYYARKTSNGSMCCSIGRHKNVAVRHNANSGGEEPQNLREQGMTSEMKGKGVKTITNKKIPTNKEVSDKKPQMDQLINKLDKVKIQRKNIIFNP